MPPVRAAVFLSAVALLAGCSHVEEQDGPAGIPYACAGGGTARIFYDGGDPTRVAARLEYDGREYSVLPAPAETGLRYVSATGLIWSTEGDAAVLRQQGGAADPAGDGREIARCTRVRGGGAPPPETGHGG
jgi:hypothetical protein